VRREALKADRGCGPTPTRAGRSALPRSHHELSSQPTRGGAAHDFARVLPQGAGAVWHIGLRRSASTLPASIIAAPDTALWHYIDERAYNRGTN
jgi:hypothetical protein